MTYVLMVRPMMDQVAAGPQQRIMVVSSIMGMIMGVAVGMLYPVALLILLTRPRVSEAFAREQGGQSGTFSESGNPYQPPRA
jgi:hypothetical protein